MRTNFRNLSRKQQQAVAFLVVGSMSLFIVYTFWSKKKGDKEALKEAQANIPHQVSLNKKLTEESAFEEARRSSAEAMKGVQKLTETVDALTKRLDRQKDSPNIDFSQSNPPSSNKGPRRVLNVPAPEAPNEPLFGANPGARISNQMPVPDTISRNVSPLAPVPPPPTPLTQAVDSPSVPPPTGGPLAASAAGESLPPGTPSAPPRLIGGIVSFANNNASADRGQGSSGRKSSIKDSKKNSTHNKDGGYSVYLPPSIMPAMLLTGLDASTSDNGDGGAEPMLLRVQAPAILPNALRASLRGCFVTAEGTGRLDKERVNVRILGIHCLNTDGHAVIDSELKGFVADADGKSGLSGHVVSRMGSATARAMLAGVISGAGEALKTGSTTQSVSPLGTTQILNPDQMARSAFGGAIANGIDPVVDLYVDLAKQATPIIEVLPGAEVTVITTEGVNLEITVYEHSATY